MGVLNQRQLAGDGVDGVHDVVVLGKIELPRGLGGIENGISPHDARGVDRKHPLLCRVHLPHPHGIICREDLPVQIGQADGVVVNEIKLPHAAAGQGFQCVAADSAQPEQATRAFCSRSSASAPSSISVRINCSRMFASSPKSDRFISCLRNKVNGGTGREEHGIRKESGYDSEYKEISGSSLCAVMLLEGLTGCGKSPREGGDYRPSASETTQPPSRRRHRRMAIPAT